jgi:hypothetical protein
VGEALRVEERKLPAQFDLSGVLSQRPLPHLPRQRRGGGSLQTGRFIADAKANQGDLLGTLLSAGGIPLDRPIGIGTKIIKEMLSA